MLLGEPLRFKEIIVPSREEVLRMNKEEKAAHDIMIEKAIVRNDINRTKVLFKLGIIKRLEDKTRQAGSWEAYGDVFVMENRNKFERDDITIMNTIARITRIAPTEELTAMHLVSAVSGYLITEAIQGLQIKSMLDRFLKIPLASASDDIRGIQLFWDN